MSDLRWFSDGDCGLHLVGHGHECCSILGRSCEREGCDGFAHGHCLYDGIAYTCERCEDKPGDPMPTWQSGPIPYYCRVWRYSHDGKRNEMRVSDFSDDQLIELGFTLESDPNPNWINES